MTSEQIDIADMQCWVFRMAQTKWGKPPGEVATIFMDNGVFEYVSDLYGLLHLNSYDCALKDVEDYLSAKGVGPC